MRTEFVDHMYSCIRTHTAVHASHVSCIVCSELALTYVHCCAFKAVVEDKLHGAKVTHIVFDRRVRAQHS